MSHRKMDQTEQKKPAFHNKLYIKDHQGHLKWWSSSHIQYEDIQTEISGIPAQTQTHRVLTVGGTITDATL